MEESKKLERSIKNVIRSVSYLHTDSSVYCAHPDNRKEIRNSSALRNINKILMVSISRS